MLERLSIRPFREADRDEVIRIWHACNLVVPRNDPGKDISLKMAYQPRFLLVGEIDKRLVATVMAGYDGHRGWINYLAVLPRFQKKGIGKTMLLHVLQQLKDLGCPKVNLQVRKKNLEVVAFYKKMGFNQDNVISMGFQL